MTEPSHTVHLELQGPALARALRKTRPLHLVYRLPVSSRYGYHSLKYPVSCRNLARWVRAWPLVTTPARQVVFLDTETTGLLVGPGTYAFLIGAGVFEENHFAMHQFFMPHPGYEPTMLRWLNRFLARRAIVITFNGRSFDMPLLASRYVMNRLPLGTEALLHVDLLPLCRRFWRDRLDGCSLGRLEEGVLGLARTDADIPGRDIPDLYRRFVLQQDGELAGVLYHNRMDLASMAVLYEQLATLADNPRESTGADDDVALSRLYLAIGNLFRAIYCVERAQERGPLSRIHLPFLAELAQCCRNHGQMLRARRLYRLMAGMGDFHAMMALAKDFEHNRKRYARAMTWCRRAAALQLNTKQAHSLQRRIERLQRKLKH